MAIKSRKAAGASPLTGDALHQRIAEQAYELYCSRGRDDGRDLEDWYEAEQLVLGNQGARAGKKAPRLPARRSPGRSKARPDEASRTSNPLMDE